MRAVMLDGDQVLDSLIAGHPRTADDVAGELRESCSSVVATLNKLLGQGLVERSVNARGCARWEPV